MAIIKDFEDISSVDEETLRERLAGISAETIVKAWIGTAPDNAKHLSSAFPFIDFEKEKEAIGRIRVKDVDAAQQELLNALR